MLTGIRLKASPNSYQKKVLSQWMGCARYIWNAKCRTDQAQRQVLIKQELYLPVNKTYAQYKNKTETAWLYQCPSVILRNSVANWATTYQNFFKKRCGRPQHKKKDGRGSIYLTRELFQFVPCADGVTRLFIGTKTNNIGYLSIKKHRPYQTPNSLYIKKRYNQYWVSFCYEDHRISNNLTTPKAHLKHLHKQDEHYLTECTVGIDRGIARPVQSSDQADGYDLTIVEQRNKLKLERKRQYYQKKLARQQKGSQRRYRTKVKLAHKSARIANIRSNFSHHVSRKIVNNPNTKVIVFENLSTQWMTKKPKPKKDLHGKYLPNKARAKAGLNKNILDKNWYQLENYTTYKAQRAGKVVFKIAPNYTSQECAYCHHIHPQNRKSQAQFLCVSCGHTDNADVNAAKVIQWRAIQLILNSGTELSDTGVLSLTDSGRGAKVRRCSSTGDSAVA